MNKNAIQKYAIWARNELIKEVGQRAYQYGIDESGGDANAVSIAGRVLSKEEQTQRRAFIDVIARAGCKQAVEEVAYTWFNRFVALRYMEVNDFLPSHIRVLSDANGEFKPEILKNAHAVELEGLDGAKVAALINDSDTEGLYRYLLLTQCNALNALLPEMFERLGAYTEMLLPNNILKPDGVIGRLVSDIPEEDFRDAVQIIGWLYQYYNTEPKQAVFDGLKKNVKITRENIPAATQLFTPDWIVRYMVENSLGRLFIVGSEKWEVGREKEIADKFGWKYYIPTAEQNTAPTTPHSPLVTPHSSLTAPPSPLTTPHSSLPTNFRVEDVKILDPCMGSGHILVYAFDVLMQIYLAEGYAERDAAKLILEKNLYGLEIDRRAYQLAYFALMMKARQYNRRILTQGVKPQLYYPGEYADGREYGSLVVVDSEKWEAESERPEEPRELTLFDDYASKLSAYNFRRLLAQKYDVVVTNPPYMGNKGLNAKMSEYLQREYVDYKSDTFSAFIIRCGEMAKPSGYVGIFSPYVWMFIQSYEKLRNNLYSTKNITTLIQFEYSAFEEATVPVCTFVYRNAYTSERGSYFRLVDFRGGMEVQRQKYLEAVQNPKCGYFHTANAANFAKIPGSPVAYWVGEKMLRAFEVGKPLSPVCKPTQGLATGDNGRFVRYWHEVSVNNLMLTCNSRQAAENSGVKWFPYNKGGDFRKWYGNNDCIVNWVNDGSEIRNFYGDNGRLASRPQNMDYYFKESATWSKISSGSSAFRYKPQGHIFDVAGTSIFSNDHTLLLYVLGFCNSVVVNKILEAISPTLNYEVGHIASLPVIERNTDEIMGIVNDNIALSRADWDAFETSWDFARHPLI